MKRIWLILALSSFLVGVYGSAEPVFSSDGYGEFYNYAINNIVLVMKHSGFIIVREKFEMKNSGTPGLSGNLFTLFRLEAYPEVMKKYFKKPSYRFFSVEMMEAGNSLYLNIRVYWNSNGHWIPIHHIYGQRLDKDGFKDWRKIVDSEKFLAEVKNKVALSLLGLGCTVRSELLPQKKGDSKEGAKTKGRLGTSALQKFSYRADAFLSILFKELKNSYNLRFTVNENYPVVSLKIFEFPKNLENTMLAERNLVVLEYISKGGEEAFKITTKSRPEKETSFFTAKLHELENIMALAKNAAQDIFQGFYLLPCADYPG